MSIEQNKAAVRRYIEEFWGKGNLEAAPDIVSKAFLFHSPLRELEGIEAIKQFVAGIHATFPDIGFAVEDVIAEGDKAVVHWTMTGTHNNEFMGIAPTGNHFTVPGATITRLSGGKLVEAWLYWDRLGLVEQLGVSLPSD